MAIIIDENKSLFTIHTDDTTYQFKADERKRLIHTYYGARIDDCDLYPQLEMIMADRGFSPNPYGEKGREYSLDFLPQEYSTYGTGDFRIAALAVRDSSGSRTAGLTYEGYETGEGLLPIEGLPAAYGSGDGCEHLSVFLRDETSNLLVTLRYGVIPGCDVIVRSVDIKNEGDEDIYLEKAASLCLDIPFGDYEMITFYGRHAMERNLDRRHLPHGISSIGSTRGHSSHHYNPFAIICREGTTEDYGEAYGVAFAYSGCFLLEAEKDQTNATRLLCGIHPDDFTWYLTCGERLSLPQTILTFSDRGLSKLSHNLHRTIREHICRGQWRDKERPVLLNNWEGTYFDFTGDKLVSMAACAKELGVELFVLDDGWFGARDSDDRALGDWFANEDKLGCTLKELGEKINDLGLSFGLWVEPEALSENSDLYRAHPDWAVAVPGRKPAISRDQLFLDFSRAEVCDYITERLCAILEEAPISYIKWDMNRSLCDKYSNALPKERQGEFAHRYILGLYRILETLTSRFPEVLFEGCAGGGGRFDAGMLYYTPQIWLSDNTDPINRLRIQYGSSFCYPPIAMGAHVSASPNEQTGRTSLLATRGAVAMVGAFGYELDVEKLSEEEKEEIKKQIVFYKENRTLLQRGRYYRIAPREAKGPSADYCTAWLFVDENGKNGLLSAVYYNVEANIFPTHVRVPGFDGEGLFEVCRVLSDGSEEKLYSISGSALSHAGVTLPPPQKEGESVILMIKDSKMV